MGVNKRNAVAVIRDVVGEPTWLVSDLTGNGRQEIVFRIQTDNPWKCVEGEDQYTVFVVTDIGGGKSGSAEGNFCLPHGDPAKIESLLLDQDGDGLLDIVINQFSQHVDDLSVIYEDMGTAEYVDDHELWDFDFNIEEQSEFLDWELDDAFLAGEGISNARNKLRDLRSNISEEDPYFDHGFQHYSYLIALSYELEGNLEEARRIYLETALMRPHTPFGDLAASRLISVGLLSK